MLFFYRRIRAKALPKRQAVSPQNYGGSSCPLIERGAAHEHGRSFAALFSYHRYLQPVYSGIQKEVTAAP